LALSEVRAHDSFGGPYAGRVYIWILSQAVAGLIPQRGAETSEVFPATANALGFDEWRRDFLQIYGSLFFLRTDHERFLSDFALFLYGTRQEHPHLVQAIGSVRNNVESLYRRMDETRASVDYIDNQTYLSMPYRLTERFRWSWLFASLSVACLAGIIIPMFLIAMRRTQLVPLVLGALSALCFGVVLTVLWDGMGAPPRTSKGDYIRGRWYMPIGSLLKRHESGIANRDALETALLWDALNRPERQHFPAALVTRLEEYLEATRRYNQAAESLGAEILARMRKDPTLARLVGLPKGPGGGLAPNLLTVTNSGLRRTIERTLASEPATQISFVTPGRERSLILRTNLSGQDIAALLAALEKIGTEVSGMREFQQFGQIVERVSGSLAAVRSTLDPLLR